MHTLPASPYLFPNPLAANPDNEGLVAVGADLSPSTLLEAYTHGIFPWFNAGEPICWWSPDPRCIIYPASFTPSKSLLRQLKKNEYVLTINRCFTQVMQACAAKRAYADSTWIHAELIEGYTGLHAAGLAHSIEVWAGTPNAGELVGGLYGIQLGQAFFGESMFSQRTDVSKMAFYLLMQLCAASGFGWVDCQLPNPHLMSLGAVTLPRATFIPMLEKALQLSPPAWQRLAQLTIHAKDLIEPKSMQQHFALLAN